MEKVLGELIVLTDFGFPNADGGLSISSRFPGRFRNFYRLWWRRCLQILQFSLMLGMTIRHFMKPLFRFFVDPILTTFPWMV